MAYILREYRCSACGHRWESLNEPTTCPAPAPEPGAHHVPGYTIERVIGKPASYKHSSWESWRKR